MGKRSIRFDDDVEAALQQAAEATGMTFTQLVNEGMRAYLLNDEDKLSLYNLNRRLQAVEERLGMAAE